MFVDPVVGTSPIEVAVEPELRRVIGIWAAGRPLVIDYFTSRRGALTVGDLTVGFASRPLEPRYVELEPVAGVRVLAERTILEFLADGAVLRRARLPFARRLAISLVHPEHWIEFLERHPQRCR